MHQGPRGRVSASQSSACDSDGRQHGGHECGGVGSCFWLRLPLQAVESEASRRGRADPRLSQLFGRRPRAPGRGRADQSMIAEHMVTNFDYSVEIASNRLYALEAVSERPFDVLMDVSMPEMDGVGDAAHSSARDEIAKIPIVGVTAYAMEEDRARFVAAGMDAFVTKPLERDALHAAMAAMLAPTVPDEEDSMTIADESQPPSDIVDGTVLEESRGPSAPSRWRSCSASSTRTSAVRPSVRQRVRRRAMQMSSQRSTRNQTVRQPRSRPCGHRQGHGAVRALRRRRRRPCAAR